MTRRKYVTGDKPLPEVKSAVPGEAHDSLGRPLVVQVVAGVGRAGRKLDFRWNDWLMVYFDRQEKGTAMFTVLAKLKKALASRRVHIRAQCTRTQFIDMCRDEGVGGKAEIGAANELFTLLCKAKNGATNATITRRRRINRALAAGSRDYQLEPELHRIVLSGDGYTTELILRYFKRFGITAEEHPAMIGAHGLGGKGADLSAGAVTP